MSITKTHEMEYCPYFLEYMKRHPGKTWPHQSNYPGNREYIDWIMDKHRQFKQEMDYPNNQYPTHEYSEAFTKWLQNGN